MKPKPIILYFIAMCFCGYVHAQTAPMDFWGITPKVRRSLTRTESLPEQNPFRKLIGTPVKAVLSQSQASGTFLKRIEDAIGGEHIGGVIVPPSGDPQIIIRGHCFSVNEDLLIADSKGVLHPMVSGHKVRIVGITTKALLLEVTQLSGEGGEVSENVTLHYDDFFHFD